MTVRPRRSVLYVPGANARALEKARTLPADALILDLEDAVAPEAKAEARVAVAAAIEARAFGLREVLLRINALDTEWASDDLSAVVRLEPDAILVPKIASGADVERANRELENRGASRKTALWAMMEMPQAILAAREIAAAAKGTRLAGLVAGTNDLSKELRARQTPGRPALTAALSVSVLAARSAGLAVIDGVFNEIQDVAGFEAECRQGADFGFDGKTVIHPNQIDTANRIFSPDPAEVTWARKIIGVFDEPQHRGKGVIKIDGQMVELLHVDQARKLVALADAIAALSEAT